jgi:hypothetical protein
MSDELLITLQHSVTWAEINRIDLPIDLQVRACLALKSLPFFQRTITRLVKTLYDGYIGGEFVTIMKSLISGQMRKAYQEAWAEDGNEGPLPEYLAQAAQQLSDEQANYVQGYYQDIVDAKQQQSGAGQLEYRAQLWANRYTQARNDASHLIELENGGKEEWIEGDTVDKCDTCLSLNGIVAYAKEWEIAGFHPQHGPNPMLDCQGYNCQCRRQRTNKRRTPKALDRLLNIAASRVIP